jgi:molybdopterin synthase sulfur carrier subunit
VKILYFASLKEKIGRSEEDIDCPPETKTVGDLLGWLQERGEGYAHAFEDTALIKAAVDQEHATLDAPIAGAREIAFFPPVTGG